jgi:hypothetical protein
MMQGSGGAEQRRRDLIDLCGVDYGVCVFADAEHRGLKNVRADSGYPNRPDLRG